MYAIFPEKTRIFAYSKIQEIFMSIRINVNSLKNALGTVFLLVAAFFVCSTLVSMRTVFADPIVNPNAVVQQSGRQSPRATTTRTSRATVSRATTARPTAKTTTSRATTSRATTSRATASRATIPGQSRVTVSRGSGTRNVSSRGSASTRGINAATRTVTSRVKTAATRSTGNRAVRARTATSTSRIGTKGSVMSATRASTGNSYSYLSSKLYTGTYSNIVDSTTGLISADAYSNCLDAYYTCMDEICTARSDTKGRCSCAGRVTNFLAAEEALETANEELIKLSGQLSLLIATKGKGDGLKAAFSLTDAEKVMNCVSYQQAEDKDEWCKTHQAYNASGEKTDCGNPPAYCKGNGNNFGFDIKDIDGSSSDILAQLKSWADAKDLSKQYYNNDTNNLFNVLTDMGDLVNGLAGITLKTTEEAKEVASLDSLANTWGYDLFQYAHNNVCGRVLDSCFNGIYETCGNPGSYSSLTGGNVSVKCANGTTSQNCPFNYNSYISVKQKDGVSTGEVVLSDRSTVSASQTASCFGYSTYTSTTGRTVSSSSDPYATLRGPVADARRSIIQKYLLDANAACDVYGDALKKTAQNINYQKIAAEQALERKRLEFKQDEDSQTLADATEAGNNFSECISELVDCYESASQTTTSAGVAWTDARVKTYCAQIAQVPHCYETMICSPSTAQFHAVIDKPDSEKCYNSEDFRQNSCRNIVTISEILNVVSLTPKDIPANDYGSSKNMREQCLRDAGVQNDVRDWFKHNKTGYVECSDDQLDTGKTHATAGYTTNGSDTCETITDCEKGVEEENGSTTDYIVYNNKCVPATEDCKDDAGEHVKKAHKNLSLENGRFSSCIIDECKPHYQVSTDGKSCDPILVECDNLPEHAVSAKCFEENDELQYIVSCESGYVVSNDNQSCENNSCLNTLPINSHAKTANYVANSNVCKITSCLDGYYLDGNNKCQKRTRICTDMPPHASVCKETCSDSDDCSDDSGNWDITDFDCESGYTKNPNNTCSLDSCPTGQHKENGTCVSNTKGCPKPANAASCTQTWDDGEKQWGDPVITCNTNFYWDGDSCESKTRPCKNAPDHALSCNETCTNNCTGNPGDWGISDLTCQSGYTPNGNTCVADNTGSECQNGVHSNGKCNCLADALENANAKIGWLNQDGECVPTECEDDYELSTDGKQCQVAHVTTPW